MGWRIGREHTYDWRLESTIARHTWHRDGDSIMWRVRTVHFFTHRRQQVETAGCACDTFRGTSSVVMYSISIVLDLVFRMLLQ